MTNAYLAQHLSRAGAPKVRDAADAPMHSNPVLNIALHQLHVAAENEISRSKQSLSKKHIGFHLGRADAYRHVISVLSQVKL